MLTRPTTAVLFALFAILSLAAAPEGSAGASQNGGADGVGDTIELTAEERRTAPETNADRTESTAGDHAATAPSSISSVDPLQALFDKYCAWSPMETLPELNDPAWEGHSPSDGTVKWRSCSVIFPGAPAGPGNMMGLPFELGFFPNPPDAGPPPPPDPQVIAQRAIRQLHVPQPQIGVGPDRNRLAVNLWTWLWTEDPGPLTATAAAGGVSVTATATLASITWNLGEPAATGGAYEPGPPVTVTCQGTGTAPPANYDWKAEPPCGHKYTWMSTKKRTGSTGKWPIAATSNWNVTWQSNTGVTGSTTLSSTGNDALEIGEYRAVLVQGPGG